MGHKERCKRGRQSGTAYVELLLSESEIEFLEEQAAGKSLEEYLRELLLSAQQGTQAKLGDDLEWRGSKQS